MRLKYWRRAKNLFDSRLPHPLEGSGKFACMHRVLRGRVFSVAGGRKVFQQPAESTHQFRDLTRQGFARPGRESAPGIFGMLPQDLDQVELRVVGRQVQGNEAVFHHPALQEGNDCARRTLCSQTWKSNTATRYRPRGSPASSGSGRP